VARALLLAAALLSLGTSSCGMIDRLVFQPSPGVDLTPEQLGVEGREVYLDTEDGVRIHGFVLPAPGATRAILFLHGNAGNASHRLPNAARLMQLGATVLVLDYRGYGRSAGTPSEAGVYADARAGFDHLTNGLGFPPGRVVVFGRSLGGVVAVDLARHRTPAGMILESTFTSVADMARGMLGVPLGPLLRGRFDALGKIGRVRCPLLFFHGDADGIVPYRLGRTLYEAAPEPKAFETLAGAGHNDTVVVGGEPYFERIGAFLGAVAPAGSD